MAAKVSKVAAAAKDSKPQPSYIIPDLWHLVRKVDDLLEDPDNARLHSDPDIATIAESLTTFKQQKPIVLRADGKVTAAGAGTLMAAKKNGWVWIAAVNSGLEGVMADAFALADNRTAERSRWSYEAVAAHMKAISDQLPTFDLNVLGWTAAEREPLLAADWRPPTTEPLPEKGDEPESHQGRPIAVTDEQRLVIDMAIQKVRDDKDDQGLSEGHCIELLCAAFLASAK